MSAMIAALCHFCEVHGPSVVMVTQSLQDSNSIRYFSDTGSDLSQLLKRNNFARKVSSSGCERCWSLQNNETLLVTKDSEGKRNYASSQTVFNPDSEMVLKNAVIRAISCEVIAKREGSIVFSDPSVSTVFSNNFFVKDVKARGFQRFYSLVLLTKEREHIISNVKLIQTLTAKIIENIKQKAKNMFDIETSDDKAILAIMEKSKGSPNSALRNLRDVIGDQSFYESLHRNFVVILQSLEKVSKDKVLSGQVMKSSVTFPKASLNIILQMKTQLGTQHFKIILYHILSGRTLQIKSQKRYVARKVGDCLCIFLPNNLSRNQICFANLILTTNELIEDLPATAQLEINENSKFCSESEASLKFNLNSDNCKCYDNYVTDFSYCKFCKSLNESTIISKLCKILKNSDVPQTVQEMKIRTFGEIILLQSRVFCKLNNSQRNQFLKNNNYTAIDAEIFIFYKFFS